MDLIYMNSFKEDIGILKDYVFDLAYGNSENDFECKVDINHHVCEEDYYLYIEGTEYGGIVDNIQVDSDKNEIVYSGRTWHGILESKVIVPDQGNDYYLISGDLNYAISEVIKNLELDSLFIANSKECGKVICNYQFPRFVKGYTALKNMLRDNGYKLHISFINGTVCLSAIPLVKYSDLYSDMLGIKLKKCLNPINHVICLGKGELQNRVVLHLYADADGNVSTTKTFTGIKENTEIYNYPSAETEDELLEGGTEIIKMSWNSNTLFFKFNSNDENYDIGDIVVATERVTNISVVQSISKKIISINNNQTKISYEVGD